MAIVTAQQVKETAGSLLKTSNIDSLIIDNRYIPLSLSEVLDKVSPVYAIPLRDSQGLLLDENYPEQVKTAVLFKSIAMTIINNYADKASNQSALSVAQYYDKKADDIIKNIVSGTIILTNLVRKTLAETELSFAVQEADEIDERAESFISFLSNRFI